MREDRNKDAAKTESADHRPIQPLQIRHTVESKVHARHEAAHDKPYDTNIVKRVSDAGHEGGVIRNGMICCRHAQTEGCPREEASKSNQIRLGGTLISRS